MGQLSAELVEETDDEVDVTVERVDGGGVTPDCGDELPEWGAGGLLSSPPPDGVAFGAELSVPGPPVEAGGLPSPPVGVGLSAPDDAGALLSSLG